jgi:hypothetical protein
VRSEYPVADAPSDPPAGRYVKKTGTVVDTLTKLEWQLGMSSDSQLPAKAADYCTNLSTNDTAVPAGGKTWRLPTLKELATIWSEGAGGLEPTAFGPTYSDGYIWSSTIYWCASNQSIPNYNTQVRLDWQPAGKKFFLWETEAQHNLSPTKCVRDAE